MKITKYVYYKENNKQQLKSKMHMIDIISVYDKSKINSNGDNYYEFFTDCINKNLSFGLSLVEIECAYCHGLFEIDIGTLLNRTHFSKFGYKNINCNTKECRKEHKRFVISEQTKLNSTSAKGHKVTEDQIKRMLETNKTSEKVKKQHENRQGKTFEEYFGEEKAKIAKDKIRYARSIQPEPHLGFKNTEEVKKLMSNKKIEFLEHNPNFSKEQGIRISNSYWSKTEEYRIDRRLKTAIGMEKTFRERHRNWGYHKAWWQTEKDKDQTYQSNYELQYYKLLDSKQILYKSNYIIYLPYISPLDNEKHFYIPDVLIYNSNWVLEKIAEVKPYEFAYNPNNNDSIYYKITKEKLTTLKDYCILNNLKYSVITEKELNLEVK
jgi:hypothetical protein